ncbi:MAG: ADP-glyceromanno-heptose 6-epimerase [Opitutaceae bacterium]
MPSTPATPSLRARTLLSVTKKQLIVTGGAGFFGRNLIAALNERGEENILIVDRLGNADKWRNLLGLRFDDLMDVAEFRRRVREDRAIAPSTLFHLGAIELPTHENHDALIENNYRASREFCEWCLKHGGRFIHASSASTYGDGSNGYFDNEDLLPGLRPLDAHAYSKHLFDLWVARSGSLAKIAAIKPFSVYGPHETHKAGGASLVLKLVQQIQATGEAVLYKSHRDDIADGEQARDFIHVRDVVALLIFLFDHPEACGLFNCGTEKARTFNEVAALVFRALDVYPKIHYIDMPGEVRDGFQYFTQAEMSRARGIGFTDELLTLEEGVADYVSGFLRQQDQESDGLEDRGADLSALPAPSSDT